MKRLATPSALLGCLLALALMPAASSASLSINTNPENGLTASNNNEYQQSVKLAWSGRKQEARKGVKGFTIPGIGVGQVACKTNVTWIQIRPSNPNVETTMWTIVSETKQGRVSTAVKDARVYKYSTPTSTVDSGTGATVYEGFNQSNIKIEDSSHGSMIGLISQRGALNGPAGASPPPTYFQLYWKWSGFHGHHPSCQVTANLSTQINTPQSSNEQVLSQANQQSLSTGNRINSATGGGYLNLNWSGETDIPASEQRPAFMNIPGAGVYSASCPAGIDSLSQLTMTESQLQGAAVIKTTTYQGEGDEAYEPGEYFVDPSSGLFSSIPLPVNGMIVADVYDSLEPEAEPVSMFVISSYRKTNDPNPEENYCQVSGESVPLVAEQPQQILELLR